MSAVKILPLCLGQSSMDASLLVYRQGMGTKTHSAFGCYYVEADGKKMLVDSGLPEAEHAARWHHEVGPEIGPDQHVLTQLEKRGIKPEEIDLLLMTHLHWDHAYNLEKFPNAKIYTSKRELEFALNPLPPFFFSYENWKTGLTPFFIPSIPRMVQIDMAPTKITEHVSMIPTPGHCPGHMAVVLETAQGPYVFSGDAIIKRVNAQPLPERHWPIKMIGLYMDFEAGWKSIRTILDMVDNDPARILPGHDEEALSQDIYIPD